MSEPMPESQNRLTVDIISDIVCPWCYVGKRHLELAINSMPDMAFDIRWRPYQLNPQMPKQGMARDEYMAQKFGEGSPTKNFYKQLEDIGQDLDINFKFNAIEFAPNTLDAHRLIHWAGGKNGDYDGGKLGHQNRLMTKLFEIYFEQGGDLGDQNVLIEAAKSMGMNGELVSELLQSEHDVDAIKEQVAMAAKMGISGVPCFIIENKYAVMGAQKPQALVEAFVSAYEEKQFGLADGE